jgi:hypothetical protein
MHDSSQGPLGKFLWKALGSESCGKDDGTGRPDRRPPTAKVVHLIKLYTSPPSTPRLSAAAVAPSDPPRPLDGRPAGVAYVSAGVFP